MTDQDLQLITSFMARVLQKPNSVREPHSRKSRQRCPTPSPLTDLAASLNTSQAPHGCSGPAPDSIPFPGAKAGERPSCTQGAAGRRLRELAPDQRRARPGRPSQARPRGARGAQACGRCPPPKWRPLPRRPSRGAAAERAQRGGAALTVRMEADGGGCCSCLSGHFTGPLRHQPRACALPSRASWQGLSARPGARDREVGEAVRNSA